MSDVETAQPETQPGQGRPSWDDSPVVDPATERLVKKWNDKIRRAEKAWKKTFDRMRECRQLARNGASKEWLESNAYVVPLIPRQVNAMVSALYAKDPRVEATPRKKLMYTMWDETQASLQVALQNTMASINGAAAMLGAPPPQMPSTLPGGGPQMSPPGARPGMSPAGGLPAVPGGMPGPMGGAPIGPPQLDPNAAAIMQEIQAAKQYDLIMTRLGKTMGLCWDYFTTEQKANFKLQMKALVRRTKINGVGWLKLGYQRILKKNPEITAGIQDITDKIADIKARLALVAENAPGYEEDSAKVKELQLSMADLQDQETIVVREGPIFDFPRSDEIILDPKVRHLKSLTGAKWAAHRLGDFSREEVLEDYGVDVKNCYTRYIDADKAPGAKPDDESCVRLYEVQDIEQQMCFVIADGYPDFIKAPYCPDVVIERFWTLFPLVFNEVESDDEEVYPPSDVWMMRHPQSEYNRARQGLREHRQANRPKYVTGNGFLEEEDKARLTSAPAHAVIEINGMRPEDDINKKLQKMEMTGIDPNMYQVEEHYKDTLRAVGSQEANLGGISSDTTATQTSVAEQSHQSGISDQIDELNDFLSEVARSTGQLMLRELSVDTVKEIAGPGAVWPDHPMSRDMVAKDLMLTIRAGSSGRPNAAQELAKLERAAPYIIQVPGINPEPLAQKYAELLDIDFDKLYTAGIPSISAMNAMAGKLLAASTGNPATDPNAQGGQGGNNQKNPQDNEPGSQPGYPTAIMDFDHNGTMVPHENRPTP